MRKAFFLLLFFAVAGLVASGIMVEMHRDLVRGGFEGKSFCNVSEFVDCDTALASRYAKVAGIPTAQIGLLYYLFFIGALLFAWIAERRRDATLSFLLAGSVGAVVYSLAMAYLSVFRLQVLCLLCLTTYFANLVHFLLLPRLLGLKFSNIVGHLSGYLRSMRFVSCLIVFVLTLGGGLLFFRGSQARVEREFPITEGFYLQNFYATQPTPLTLERFASWGPADAKVTIVEFSDFQCPFCRRAAFTIKPLLGEFRRQVRLVFVNYPLDHSCNPQVGHSMHPVACLAAKGALCAGEKGKFWEFHDLVFENQKKLSRSILLSLAKQAGLEEEWFNLCLVDPQTEGVLAAEVQEGAKFGVRGTPAIYINGRPFHDWTSPEKLRWILQSELKQ